MPRWPGYLFSSGRGDAGGTNCRSSGATIERSLSLLGFPGVRNVRIGKLISLTTAAETGAARAEADDLCRRFLTNPVLKDSAVRIEAGTASVR